MSITEQIDIGAPDEIRLHGKRALVTGGSRGIGRAITRALVRRGARVVACHREDNEAAATLAQELRNREAGQVVRADVTSADDVERLVEQCDLFLGGLDIVVNNAGAMSQVPLTELTLAEWQRVLDVNLTGVYLVVRAALPLLAPGASVVNVGSGLATVGMAGRTHYTASKAGLLGLTRSLCKELGPRGIRVNTVAPGVVETDLAAGLTPEQRRRYESLVALGRLGQTNDIADVVVFLVSDLARFVSGVTLNVDGGI